MLVAHSDKKPYGVAALMRKGKKHREKWFATKAKRYDWIVANALDIVQVTYYPESVTMRGLRDGN